MEGSKSARRDTDEGKKVPLGQVVDVVVQHHLARLADRFAWPDVIGKRGHDGFHFRDLFHLICILRRRSCRGVASATLASADPAPVDRYQLAVRIGAYG